MSKLPILKHRKLIRALNSLGFVEVRQKGSHRFFLNAESNLTTVVPIHAGDIGRGLLRKILNEIKISPEEFIKLLKK